MNNLSKFKIEWEWESAPLIRSGELQATFARLKMSVDDHCLTLVEDRESGSSRRAIAVSLYPLAEWFAYNWWFLCADSRHANALSAGPTWRNASPEIKTSYRRHGIRNAGDGFLWPDLVIIPEGSATRLVWRSDRSVSPNRPVRFITQGEALVDSTDFKTVVAGFIESVLDRLTDSGIDATPLHDEWRAIGRTDKDEAEYCLASARLGLDPYSEAVNYEDQILRADTELEGDLLKDFFDTVEPDQIAITLDWVSSARVEIEKLSIFPATKSAKLLRVSKTAESIPLSAASPWQYGYSAAKHVREVLNLSPTDAFNVEEYVKHRIVESPDPSVQAFGAVRENDAVALILGRPQHGHVRRFTMARAMWHSVVAHDRNFFITAGHTVRQKAERAFAAELLAPAEGIAQSVGWFPEIVDDNEIERIGEEFNVSPLVVKHQIDNQLMHVDY